ncbi:MAG: hypothetical protein FWG66_07225 [Spirochaetes bacterium]|nr:hypothetical protein [Spirochaetota bacterium]
MSKIRFAFALALATICILPLLAACERDQPGAETAALPPPQANAVQAAAAQWAAEQGAAEQPYTAAEEAAVRLTWQEAYAVFLRELMQVTDLTWRQAYAAILRELATVINVIDHWGPGWTAYGSFFLYDIDGTGTPNLIVFSAVSDSVTPHSAYAWDSGALSPIELGDMPELLGSFLVPPGDTGIVAVMSFPGDEMARFHWMELEDGIFRQRVSGMTMHRPEDNDDWHGPWRDFYFIDGQEVSVDEFRSVFPPGLWDGFQRMWRITEENIQNVVLGG